jgi:hypothetical protein
MKSENEHLKSEPLVVTTGASRMRQGDPLNDVL